MDNNYYSEIYNPMDDKEAIVGSIADDLADIYLGLKAPLLLYNQNTNESIANAKWHWNFNIKHHLGEHILGVLKPIYWIINNNWIR
jgi:hypothetical protein